MEQFFLKNVFAVTEKRAEILIFVNDISGVKISPRNSSWHKDIWGG